MNKYFVNEALEELGEAMVDVLRKRAPRDTGALENSITYSVEDNQLLISYEDYGDVLNDPSSYSWSVPPTRAIRSWANRKGINPYAVAKNIQKYGISDIHEGWLQPLEDFEDEFYQMFHDTTYDKLEEYIWKSIEKIKK